MNNLLLSSLRRVRRLLPAAFRRRFYGVLALLCCNSVLDLISLGAIVPLLPLFLNPDALRKNAFLSRIHESLPFLPTNAFVFCLLGFLIFLFLSKNLISLALNRIQARFAYDLFHHVSTSLLRLYDQRGYLFLQRKTSTDAAHEISTVAVWFSQGLVIPLLTLLNEILVLTVLTVVISIYAPKAMILVGVFLLPPFFLFYLVVRKRIRNLFERLNVLTVQLRRLLSEFVFGYLDVKTTSSEAFFRQKYATTSAEFGRLLSRHYILNLIPTRILEIAFVTGAMFLVAYSLLTIENIDQRVTLLGVFMVAAYRTLPSVNRITAALLSVKGHQHTIDTAEETLELNEEPGADGDIVSLPFHSTIEFCNVSFRYPGSTTDTLRNLTFSIEKGECVGIVGPSGAGKTTFLHVLLGFMSPTVGRILVDQTELSTNNLRKWHHLIGYVQQEVYLIEGSVTSNVAFGKEPTDVDPRRLARALQLARLDEVIADLPEGIDSFLGERGARLSIGQKQRVGIARAIYAGAEVLILDEVTSALDAETERRILDTVEALNRDGFTVILVTHRLSALRFCRRIFELRDGEISRVLAGSELLAREQAESKGSA